MIRIAAVGDVHLGEDARGHLRPALERLPDHADVLLLAGDLTRHGTPEEAHIVAEEFRDVGVPVVTVLGNHDYHSDSAAEVSTILAESGIQVLEGDGVVLPVAGLRLGVAGVKGFGGGFEGRCGSAFGEPEMKAFVNHTTDIAETLRSALQALDCDVRVALTHYAPIPDTLDGEPLEIYPFLGAYQLGKVVDTTDTDLIVHGHAHRGCEHGVTPGGVRVRNVAQPVLRSAFTVYRFRFRDVGNRTTSREGRAEMTEQERDELPLADYDHLPISGLRDRIRSLTSAEIEQLLAYEQAHADRLPAVAAMRARLEQLEAGATPTSGEHEVRPEQTPPSRAGSPVSDDTAALPTSPAPHGVPAQPGDPNRRG